MSRGVSSLLLLLICPPAACGAVDYLRDVKPLLKHKCCACHGTLKQQAGLRLDTASALIAGGDSGPAVQLGNPGESLLIDVVTGDAGFQMPPANEGAPLTQDEIDILRKWIVSGAVAPGRRASGGGPEIVVVIPTDPASACSQHPGRELVSQ